MTHFSLVDPTGSQPVADGTESISRKDLLTRAEAISRRLTDAGLAHANIVIALDAGLGSLATLVAVIEGGFKAALMLKPQGDKPIEWPAFCHAAIVPNKAGAPLDDLQIIPLKPLPEAGSVMPEPRIWLHSSGTTGKPKWILHDTGTLLDNGRACVERLTLNDSDKVMIPVAIHHAFGLGAGLLPSLLAGASVRLVTPGNPLMAFQAQRSYEPSVIFMTPGQIRSILALGRKAGMTRLVVTAGDRLQPDEAALFEAEHGPLVSLYGSSEMGAITAGKPSDPVELRHVTAGPPMRGVSLAIDTDTPADPAADGAVPMRIIHKNGFLGYTDPDTGAMLTPAPEVWATGDLVKLHDGPDGEDRVEILGRADFAVNRDGLLVHLGQIEGCLARAPGVAMAGVAAAGRTRRGIGLQAFCALTRNADTTADDILAFCRDALPPRAVPDHVEILGELPSLPSGKVDRQALAKLAQQLVEQ